MGYGSMGLNELRDEAHAMAKSKGFHDAPKSFGDVIALIHSEVSEALEDYRNGLKPEQMRWATTTTPLTLVFDSHAAAREAGGAEPKPVGIPSEMADIIIRVLDVCGYYNIDIEQAVRDKMLYNATRSHRHGNKAL